jgi:hypothetical protein
MPMPMVKYSSVAVNAVTLIDFTKGFYWVFVLYSSSIVISNLCNLSLMARGLLMPPEEGDISREKTIQIMSVVLK